MSRSHDADEIHEHDLGLAHDLPTVLNRRRALGLMSAAGLAAALAACSGGSDSSAITSPSTSTPTTGAPGGSATPSASSAELPSDEIPTETGGPFPADGSNGVDVLGESGIVRQDITRSFGTSDGVAAGVPMTLDLTIYDMNGSDVGPLAGAAIYVWHCDIDGRYSMYDRGIAEENYLRGVQVTDSAGKVSFTSIFPAAYPGRWPHVHFEVYPSEADATSASNKLRTSQLALPEDVCNAVYATSGYEQSVSTMRQTTLDSDMVFRDGYSLQMARATGSADAGYTVSLNISV